jgi:DNA-binding transcriptional LysR family regulator
MRIRQLEYFVAIADAGSMREAAERLFVAAPSMSSQIALLEAELGGPLLERHPRGVTLTQTGRVLYRHARKVLDALQEARTQTRAAITERGGVLTFGTILSLAAGIAPQALAALSQSRPHVDVVLDEYRSAEALEAAALTKNLDFVIGPEPRAAFPYVQELGTEEIVLVVPPRLAAGHKGPVELSSLAEEPWVTFKEDHGLAILMESQFMKSGIAPSRSVSTAQTDVAIRMAAAGLGITLVPRNVVPIDVKMLIRSLEPRVERRLYGYARTPFSDLTSEFFSVVAAALDDRTSSFAGP